DFSISGIRYHIWTLFAVSVSYSLGGLPVRTPSNVSPPRVIRGQSYQRGWGWSLRHLPHTFKTVYFGQLARKCFQGICNIACRWTFPPIEFQGCDKDQFEVMF